MRSGVASPRYAQIAIQGPKALGVASKPPKPIWAAIKLLLVPGWQIRRRSRAHRATGYTGEDGFEVYRSGKRSEVWNAIRAAGAGIGIKPCGLGARNTLRLEAAMSLYGHEIGASITPFEAGLGWIVKMDKGDFVGRDALEKQRESG